jgi:beta-galactosidase
VPVAWQSGLPVPSFDPQDRRRISLSGTWRKQRMRLNTSLTLGAQTLGQLEIEARSRHLPSFNDRKWFTISLPMVENAMPLQSGSTRGPEVYESGVWYRRTFQVPQDWQGQRVTLNFLGANYVVDVWINGVWVGYHEGGYTPFAFDATPGLRYGAENTIAVRVDNPAWGSRNDIVPAVTPDWWNYTGIIQDIYLEAAPALWVVRADVRTPDTSGRVQASVVLHNASKHALQGNLTLRIHDTDPSSAAWLTDPRARAIAGRVVVSAPDISVNVPSGGALVVPAELIIADVKTWSPAHPVLYVLEATVSSTVGTDSTMHQFGVRTVASRGHQILLNGAPFFLAGVARHEEWPDTGRTSTWNRIRQDLDIIRSLGANFVRTAHYPNHIHTYLLADRMGLATAAEIPVWQYDETHYRAQETRLITDQMWREMILSGSNRPSILFWSTNNEARELPHRTAFNRRLKTDFEQHLQDGRIVMQSAAADRGGPADSSQLDFAAAGWTLYFGVFYGQSYYQDTLDFLRASRSSMSGPVIATEYGIWSYGGGSDEARQQEVFRETFRALTEVSAWNRNGVYNQDGFVAGLVWWAAFDWYTAHTKLQTMGLYHMDRQRAKPVAGLLREGYSVWTTSRIVTATAD